MEMKENISESVLGNEVFKTSQDEQEKKENVEGIEVVGLDEFDEEYFYSISEGGEDEWKAIGMENCKNQKYYTVIGENNVKLGIVGIYDTDDEQNITHIVIDPKFRGKGLLSKYII